MVPLKKTIESYLVLREAVRPIVVAHQLAGREDMTLDKRKRDLRRRCVGQPGHCNLFGSLERLHERRGEPGMRFQERLPDAQGVHDGKELGTRVPLCRARLWIVEEIVDLRVTLIEARRRAWPDHRVELSGSQKV